MKSPKAKAVTAGATTMATTASENGTSSVASTPPTFGKSYAFRSDHSLVTVLKRSSQDPKRFHREVTSHTSLDSLGRGEGGGGDEEDEGEDLSYMDSEDSEAVLTRLHRFCWAICCCLCRSPHCCYNKNYYEDAEEEEDDIEPENNSGDEVDSDKTSAVEGDNSRCFWLFLAGCCQKFAEARTWFRQMVEFAEYGNGHTSGAPAPG